MQRLLHIAVYVLLLLLMLLPSQAKFSRKTKEQLEEEAKLEALCRHRNQGEFFRLEAEGDCRKVATCDKEPGTGSLRLGPLKCPGGLFFDIERQT